MPRKGRKPSVNYWKSRGCFGCWIEGRQRTLATGPDDRPTGPTYLAALARFQELLSGGAEPTDDSPTLRFLCERFLQFIETRQKPLTVRLRKARLVDFIRTHGEMRVADLTHAAVYQYIDGRKKEPRWIEAKKRWVKWGETTSRMFLASLSRAIRWGVKSGLVKANPLKGIEFPGERRRVADAIVSPEQHQAILNSTSPHFRELIVCLESTGCRPGELLNATAEAFDREQGALIYPADSRRDDESTVFSHKTGRKGRDRVIFFTGEALDIIKRLVDHYPSGPLFRVRKGTRGITPTNLKQAFSVIRRRVGMPKLTPGSFRHTFATRWIEAGESIDVLAELLGNTPETIRKHYSHLFARRPALRAAIERFRGHGPGGKNL